MCYTIKRKLARVFYNSYLRCLLQITIFIMSLFTTANLDVVLAFAWTIIIVIGITYMVIPVSVAPYMGYVFSILLFGSSTWRYAVWMNVPLVTYPILYVMICIIHKTFALKTNMFVDAGVIAFLSFVVCAPMMIYFAKKIGKRLNRRRNKKNEMIQKIITKA